MIDTHPGLNEETLLSIAISDALIIIMRPDSQDYQGTIVTVDVAKKLDVPNLLIVVNKVPEQFLANGGEQKIRADIEEKYDATVGAIFPHSDHMMTLASSGIFSVKYPDDEMSKSLRKLVDQLKA